jgi:hypothetical protein
MSQAYYEHLTLIPKQQLMRWHEEMYLSKSFPSDNLWFSFLAHIEITDWFQPFVFGCVHGCCKVVKHLLHKHRPLILCNSMICQHVHIVKILIEYGADCSSIVKIGCLSDNVEIIKLALAHGGKLECTLGEICRAGSLQAVEFLLDQGLVDVHQDMNALAEACMNDDLAMAQLLLEKGFDADIRNGFTLSIAILFHHSTKMVDLLLNHGARVNKKLLHMMQNHLINPEMIRVLEGHGLHLAHGGN